MVKDLVILFGQSAIAITALAYLAKTIIKHWLDKDVEGYKASITFKSERTLEEFKSNLEKESIKLQIQYGRVFEEQAKVLIEINKKVNLLERLRQSATFNYEDKNSYAEFRRSYVDLIDFYQDNQLVIPQEIDTVFENFLRILFNTTSKYRSTDELLSKGYRRNNVDEILKRQDKVLEAIEEIPKLREELISYMRSSLGNRQEP
ncbi:hypothetical protein [Saccharospirillum alexandrii]|uniref:hypothetical protein n=1 Tax=Saccharospirillum alexandrii TaxID=2448477 RepID=UPI0037355FA2